MQETKFADKLNAYIEKLDCTGKELSQSTSLSATTISRYRSGERTPKADGGDIEKLCRGIELLAAAKGFSEITYETLKDDFSQCSTLGEYNYEALRQNLNLLISTLAINAADLAKFLNYDSSYLSRIRNGHRKPANPQVFAQDVARFITRRYDNSESKRIVSEILQVNAADIANSTAYADALAKWLSDTETTENSAKYFSDFLRKLNEFNLNEYIRAIHFDDIKVPTLPFQLPTAKSYYGLQQMKNGEIDFLKATALAKSCEPVFMFSDMQMDDMAADQGFAKKYMFGLAVMLKKGLHLNVVHNLNRPFNELMLGLENWIPLYMTGQISPYYLKGTPSRVFCHLLNVSGSAAMAGECISGHHGKGKYYLTKNKDELAYYREKSRLILQKALPLMEIYRSDKANALNIFLNSEAKTKGRRKHILSTPPIYTMDTELLTGILDRYNLSSEERQSILDYAQTAKEQMRQTLQNSIVENELPYLTESEFAQYPAVLPLSPIFYEKDIAYSYEEYAEHMAQSKTFAENNPNFILNFTPHNAFRNIEITLLEKKWALISKNKFPAIHFVVKHPTLIKAMADLILPITEVENQL